MMISLNSRSTVIEKVIVWAGPNPYSGVLRVKVSNTGDYWGKTFLSLP